MWFFRPSVYSKTLGILPSSSRTRTTWFAPVGQEPATTSYAEVYSEVVAGIW